MRIEFSQSDIEKMVINAASAMGFAANAVEINVRYSEFNFITAYIKDAEPLTDDPVPSLLS